MRQKRVTVPPCIYNNMNFRTAGVIPQSLQRQITLDSLRLCYKSRESAKPGARIFRNQSDADASFRLLTQQLKSRDRRTRTISFAKLALKVPTQNDGDFVEVSSYTSEE